MSTTKSPKKQDSKKISSAKKFWEGIGRRKTSVARVRIYKGKGETFIINEKLANEHFLEQGTQKIIRQPLNAIESSFDISVRVSGGGFHSQAEAVRHGIARALTKFDIEFRPQMHALGFLKRDPRMRERKKFGLKRARRARQWRKR